MKKKCLTGIEIPLPTPDPCDGAGLKTSCVFSNTPFPELGLGEGATQDEINRAFYQNASAEIEQVNADWDAIEGPSEILNKPTAFPPETHTHVIGDIDQLQDALDDKAPLSHSHVISDVTGLQGELENKSDVNHTHTTSQITDFPTFKTIENQSIIGTGNIDLDKTSVGLGNVDNTSDANKPISTATQNALNGKEPTIPTGTASQYIKGDKTLGTFPTVDQTIIDGSTNAVSGNAVFDGLSGKADLSSVMTLTGDQFWTGVKSSTNSGTTQSNGIFLSNFGTTNSSYSLRVNNSSSGRGIMSTNSSTGTGIVSINSSTGTGIYASNDVSGYGINIDNSSTGVGLRTFNTGQGIGVFVDNGSSGIGLLIGNSTTGTGVQITNPSSNKGFIINSSSSGSGIISNGTTTATGLNYVGQNNGANTFTVNKLGDVVASSFTKSGGTSSQFLKADGSVDSNSYITTAGLPTIDQTIIDGSTNAVSSNAVFDGLALKGDIANQIEITTATANADASWHGKTVIFTVNCTVTVVNTVPNQFTFEGTVLPNVTVSWAIQAPLTWLVTPTSVVSGAGIITIFTLMRRGSTNNVMVLGI